MDPARNELCSELCSKVPRSEEPWISELSESERWGSRESNVRSFWRFQVVTHVSRNRLIPNVGQIEFFGKTVFYLQSRYLGTVIRFVTDANDSNCLMANGIPE